MTYDNIVDIIYQSWLPIAYKIGLDIDLFWQLNPTRLKPFIEAYEQKQMDIRDRINMQAYLEGIYVRYAIASCFDKDTTYPTEMLDLKSQSQINEWRSSEQYQEQQKVLLELKYRQDMRKKRIEEMQKEKLRAVHMSKPKHNTK